MIHEEFRELADNAPVMIWRARLDKLCDWFNKPWLEFSGKTQEELFGYGWADDVHPDDYDRCVKIYVDAFDARLPFTMSYRLRRNDGVFRWFLDNGAPFYRDSEFAGYLGSCVDITEQRDAEEHQRVLRAELDHRVKNNLQLILSFLQLSKMRASSDEAKELLASAASRIRAVGVIHYELHKNAASGVDLGDYLTGVARSVISIESERPIRLVTSTEPARIEFEIASNLGLIVNELVTNAIKHGGPDINEIRLEMRQSIEGKVELRVSDNGVGFAAIAGAELFPLPLRGTGLIDALAMRVRGELKRSNEGGAATTLIFALPPSE